MALSIRWQMEPLRTLAFGSIGASYTGIGTAFDHPGRQLLVQNFTDARLYFSLNGSDDHFRLAANTSIILDITANKVKDDGYFSAEGDRLYVKEDETPTSGGVDVTLMYGKDD